MEVILNFLTKQIHISENLSIQVWAFFTIFIALLLVIVVIIVSSKNIKKAKSLESEPEIEEKKQLTPDEASKEYFEIINKEVAVPLAQAPTTEDVAEEPLAKEETTQPILQKIEVKDEVTASVDDIVYVKEENAEKQIAGKFTIINSSIGGFRYALIANNGQLLYESRDYKSKNTCVSAVEKFCAAVNENNFAVKKDKFDRFKFVLRPKNNSNTVFIGESFKDRTGCLSNIESVKRFVFASSPIVDRTSEDYAAESTTYEVPQEIVDAVSQKKGMPGKWEICQSNDDVPTAYEFLLFANNGQLLYESKEYKTRSSCKSGINTFIDTVKNGCFIVDADKAGRYKFVLRSNKQGSQAEYIGQFYRNLDACQSSINSVYKFALLSSVDNVE